MQIIMNNSYEPTFKMNNEGFFGFILYPWDRPDSGQIYQVQNTIYFLLFPHHQFSFKFFQKKNNEMIKIP